MAWWTSCLADDNGSAGEEDTVDVLSPCAGLLVANDTPATRSPSFHSIEFDENESLTSTIQHKDTWDRAMSQLAITFTPSSTGEECKPERIQRAATTSISWLQRIPQEKNWDCGVACLQMILQWTRQKDERLSLPKLQRERRELLRSLNTQSIWTVDIVCLLDQMLSQQQQQQQRQKGRAKYLFCSTCLQVDESYGEFAYYQSSFANDNARITQLFQLLHDKELPVLQVNRLPLSQVVWIVNQPHALAMVLVDNSVLVQQKEGFEKSDETTQQQSSSYAGHYILLVGTSTNPEHVQQSCRRKEATGKRTQQQSNEESFCFVAYNPGWTAVSNSCDHSNGASFIAPSLLERAWRAKGTDEDIIFVVKHQHTS